MSGKTKILALLLLGLGLIFLMLAFLSGQKARDGGDTLKQELERFPVVVSTKEIPFGQAITADLLKIEKFALAPAGSFKDVNEVVGKKSQFTIGAGLPITAQFFEKGAVAAEVREGYRAFALRLDENNIATAKIKAGDFVDVFSIFRMNNQEITQTISRLVAPKIRVLSVGTQMVNAPDTAAADDKDPNQKNRPLKAMMVEVPLEQVNVLGVAQSQGELFVVLRSPEDDELPDPNKYPAVETVLQPIKPKQESGKPAPAPVELSVSDKAYAGVSLGNTVTPGSSKVIQKTTPSAAATPGAAAAAPSPTVEVIRGGEVSREKAR